MRPDSELNDVRTIGINALGVPVAVHVRGSRAEELAGALTTAWSWCRVDGSGGDDLAGDDLAGDGLAGDGLAGDGLASDGPAGDGPAVEPLHLDVSLEDDPALVDQARAAGRLAGTDLRAVMEWFSSTITTQAITARAGQLVMLHGCAVADPVTGATAVLVGQSGAGKTTAAITLGARFGYLTDETAAISSDLSVLPYPKPLSVRLDDGLPGKHQISPGELGLLRPGAAPAHLAAVFLLARTEDGPPDPQVVPVPTVQALALLGEQSSYLAELPRPLHRLAEVAHAVGGLRRVHYRDSSTLGEVVAAALDGHARRDVGGTR